MCVYKSAYNYTIKIDNCATHAINYHHEVGRTTIKFLPPGLCNMILKVVHEKKYP